MTKLILPKNKLAKSLHISRRLNAVYVNNPKVACSTLKLTLQRVELDDDTYTPEPSVHNHKGSPLLTWPDIQLSQNPTKGLFVFSFVRNPYSRLRSAYLNKIVTGQKRGIFRERAGFARSEIPPFRNFILSICNQPPAQHDSHWRLQALNLSIDKISYDFIGRLEQFPADWNTLRRHIKLPETPFSAGKPSASTETTALAFDSEMESAVTSTFATDFETFNYEPRPNPK